VTFTHARTHRQIHPISMMPNSVSAGQIRRSIRPPARHPRRPTATTAATTRNVQAGAAIRRRTSAGSTISPIVLRRKRWILAHTMGLRNEREEAHEKFIQNFSCAGASLASSCTRSFHCASGCCLEWQCTSGLSACVKAGYCGRPDDPQCALPSGANCVRSSQCDSQCCLNGQCDSAWHSIVGGFG